LTNFGLQNVGLGNEHYERKRPWTNISWCMEFTRKSLENDRTPEWW